VTVIGAGGSGAVTIAIGTAQTASGSSGTVAAGLKANGTSLTYTPASTYTGTITISAKLITPISTFSYLGKDSTGASSFKALYQTLGSLNNSFQGGGGTYNTTGNNNSAQGYQALYSNTTGNNNSAQGYNALSSNTTGSNNSAQGLQALYSNTTGSNNSAQGYIALSSNTTGAQNSAQGYGALSSNTTGNNNSAQGYNALPSNTTGAQNSAQGLQALYSNTTGSNNSAQGLDALFSNTTGSSNSAQGVSAGYTATPANANTTGSYNTWIGYLSGPGVVSSSSLQNATAIGNGALNMASNQIVLGNSNVTDVYLGSATAYAALHDASETVYNPTPATGVTQLVCQDGALQSTTACLQVKNNAGTTGFSVTGAGVATVASWQATNGSWKNPVATSSLAACASATLGQRSEVNDATLATPGSTLAGSGTYTIAVQCIFNSTGSVYSWIID